MQSLGSQDITEVQFPSGYSIRGICLNKKPHFHNKDSSLKEKQTFSKLQVQYH